MSTSACRECGGQVAHSARACPHCGAKVRRQIGVIGWIGAAVAGLLVFQCATEMNAPPPPAAPIDLSTSAKGACMLFVRQVLHDPDSADFPAEATATQTAPNQWQVRRSVRSRNAMNAMRLAEFDCALRFDGTRWHAISITEIPR